MLQADVIFQNLHTARCVYAIGDMQLPRGDEATARLHRDWLKRLPGITGKKLTTLAREINVSPSTLTRPVSEGDHGTSTLHANTIAKIVAAFGVAPPSELTGSRGRGAGPLRLAEDAVPFVPPPRSEIAAAIAALAGGHNGVAPYLVKTAALELAGFLPGDIVLVDQNAVPRPGEPVCARVREWPGSAPLTVLRVYTVTGPVKLLLPQSTNTRLAPIVIDDERVSIEGAVLPHRLRP